MLVEKIADDMAIDLEEEEYSRRQEKEDDKVRHRKARVNDTDVTPVQNLSSVSQTPV
ncbi:hypothetical protein TSUD_12450 [Trifolium subterraneum]|uniref:Uncharacterized protein n=1 Tax=Trifolium subterraneum TaxID=3900 RepID=A0A2Z6MDM0_TRISU|nr:hypothetical protein TSUD_12450 [Trifolium subterraneum]